MFENFCVLFDFMCMECFIYVDWKLKLYWFFVYCFIVLIWNLCFYWLLIVFFIFIYDSDDFYIMCIMFDDKVIYFIIVICDLMLDEFIELMMFLMINNVFMMLLWYEYDLLWLNLILLCVFWNWWVKDLLIMFIVYCFDVDCINKVV